MEPTALNGDAQPLLLDLSGVVYVSFAGQLEGSVSAVLVNGERAVGGDGVWISRPFPMEPGMTVSLVWLGLNGVEPVREIQTTVDPDDLGPIFDPDEWTSFAREGGPTHTREVK